MLQQLILLVDSVEYGKKVIYQIPQHISRYRLDQDQHLPLPEFITKFVKNCSHFGVVNKQHVALGLDEEVFVNCFLANQKYPRVCMYIQDDIVVSRSAFFTHRRVLDDSLSDPPQPQPINSINIIATTNKFQNVEQIKHMISFFASVLMHNQNNLGTLAEDLDTIAKNKEMFVAEVRGLVGRSEAELTESQFGGKTVETALRSIRILWEKYTKDVPLFRAMRDLYQCANDGRAYDCAKQFHMNTSLRCTLLKKQPNIMYKTILFSNRRAKQFFCLNGSIPKRLQKTLAAISPYRSLQQTSIEQKLPDYELRNVASLILGNGLGILINPINAYSKFAVCLTNKHPKSKFQQRYQQSYVQILKEIEKTGETHHTKELLFLLVNGVVRQSEIFVFNPTKKPGTLNYPRKILLKQILLKYALSGVSLEEIARRQQTELRLIVRYIHENPGQVVVYAVE